MGCEICKKGLTNESGSYYCAECKWPTAVPRYKFSLFAADDTAEAKFFCHDVVARQIIRRNCDSLLKAIKCAPGLPDQIKAVISKKYTFAVGLTDQSFRSMEARTYLIDSFKLILDQQPPAPRPVLALQPALQSSPQSTHTHLIAAGTETGNTETSPDVPPVAPLQHKQQLVDLHVTDIIGAHTPPPGSSTQETPPKEVPSALTTAHQATPETRENIRKRLFEGDTNNKQTMKTTEESGNSNSDSGTKKQKTRRV